MSVSALTVIMINIDLDLVNKQKITNIDFIGSLTFPSGYFAHLLKGLDYSSFLPFIRLKPNRLFFIYWQPEVNSDLSLEYVADLRARLVDKYYVGDRMKVSDYYIAEFKGIEAKFISGTWENTRARMRGIFELVAFKHNNLLILMDISTTEIEPEGKAIQELRKIRSSLSLC